MYFKTIITYFLLTTISLSSFTQNQSCDVRNCRWGMSVEEVKLAEGLEPTSVGKEELGVNGGVTTYTGRIQLTYKLQIGSKPIVLFYYFESNKLVAVTMAVYWSTWYDAPNDFSIYQRLMESKGIFTSFIKEKKYVIDKFWTIGTNYYESWLQENRFCKSEVPYNYSDENDMRRVQDCVKNQNFSNKWYYGITMTNGKTNIIINFPTSNMIGETPKEIICWVKYLPVTKPKTNTY